MDIMIIDLYDPTMKWFDGLFYPWCNTFPGCTSQVSGPFAEYAVNYAHSGRVWHSVDGGSVQVLEAPVAWWVPSGIRYDFGPVDGMPWDHYYICFKGPRVRQWIRGGLAPVRPPFHRSVTNPEEFRSAMMRGISFWRASLGKSTADLVHATESVLLLFQQQGVKRFPLEDKNLKYPVQKIHELVKSLSGNPCKGIVCGVAAAQVGLSEPHFRRLFRKITGFSPLDYVIRNRLMHASSMLESRDIPIKEVAARCGFADIYYFTRQFRRFYGVPPGRFRSMKRMGLSSLSEI